MGMNSQEWSGGVQCTIRRRGYSLIEAIFGLGILALLLFAVGDAVTSTLRAVALSGTRAGAARTISELATRMAEEARSSSAVFLPTTDLFGNANQGSSAHEVDMFRRLSGGGDFYVAYSFDAGTGTVTRYEYALTGAAPRIVHADLMADSVAAFAPARSPASSMAGILDPATVEDVSILYGVAGVVGGNDVVTVGVQAATRDGIAPAAVRVDLASRAAPTSLAVLAPAHAPPTPSPVHVIPFIIWHAPMHVHHGPWHFGSPADGDPEASGIHSNSIAGQIQFFGPGSGLAWLDFVSANPVVETGSYSATDSAGNRFTVVISCAQIACPKFRPLPTSGSPSPPNGGVGFDALP
jgi:hypothetical protein